MKERQTLQDVARECGVHHTTVSRALHDHPSISEATRNKIKRVAARLGYQSDPFLSALVNRKYAITSGTTRANLAWVTNFGTRDGWKTTTHNAGFFKGCSDRAKQLGCSLDDIWVGDRKEEGIERLLIARGVRGVILAPQPIGAENVPISSERFHCVAIGMSVRRDDVIQICHDHYHSVSALVKRLALIGFRKPIFYASEEVDRNVDYLMSHGFRYGVESLGLKVSPAPAYVDHAISSFDLAKRIVKDRPDVAIVHYRQWRHLEEALNGMNVSIPDDLSVAVITVPDDEQHAGGVVENSHQIGSLAVDTLVDLVVKGDHEKTRPRRLFVDGTIVLGKTIAAGGPGKHR